MLLRASVVFFIIYAVYQIGKSLRAGDESGSDNLWETRKNEVKSVFLESWSDYEANGWGYDVYHPISQKGENMGPKPLGWIIVDSLDTLMIMGCDEEVKRARSWVKNDLTYDFNYGVNVFETTIRMLGGLLSAFYLSEDDLYLDKATDLGNRILKGFESRTGIPYASVNLGTGKGVASHADSGASSTAEVATLQLEFKYLSKLTGESLYWEKVEKIMAVLEANKPKDGLVPIFVKPETGKYQGKNIRLGSRGDSYYEYLLKQYLQTGEPIYHEMYEEAIVGVRKHLIGRSKPNGYTYIGELSNGLDGSLEPKMDHLVCFMGGLLALGATEGKPINEARKSNHWTTSQETNFLLGKEITHTCYKMYHDVENTALSPEIVVFNTDPKSIKDFHVKPLDRHNLQRPETVESLYYLYKLTKDPMYRKWGYEIFTNFVKHTKVTTGGTTRYTSLDDVTTGKQRDNMESFWLAETLKYLYLLFDDEDKFDLSKVVFNTEAHVFPDFDMEPLFKTGWSRSTLTPEDEQAVQIEKSVKKEVLVEKKNAPILAQRPMDDVLLTKDDADILIPALVPKEKKMPTLQNDKPKIQAEISFNENDKKNVVNQDSKILKNNPIPVLNKQDGQKPRHQQNAPLEGQKPSKPIEEELKELNLGKEPEEPVKKFKNKDEINEKIEELILEVDA